MSERNWEVEAQPLLGNLSGQTKKWLILYLTNRFAVSADYIYKLVVDAGQPVLNGQQVTHMVEAAAGGFDRKQQGGIS